MADTTAKWVLADVLLEAAQMDTLIETCIQKYPSLNERMANEMRLEIQEQLKCLSSVVANFL